MKKNQRRDTSQHFVARGGAAELFQSQAAGEVLIEGPAGTGKSRACAEYLHSIASNYPGCRLLVVRKTRASMVQSFQMTFEDEVLPHNHPVQPHTHLNGQLRSYRYPNGSVIVMAGMDHPTRIYSTQYDVVYVQEAVELSEDEWERLHRCLRNYCTPFQQLLGDTNPDSPTHWLNRRCERGLTKRILSRHEDNPSCKPDYLERLRRMTGVRYDRLYLGRWVAAEGLILTQYDPLVHLVSEGELKARGVEFKWHMAVMDFGITNPGVLQVWGFDQNENAYRRAEVYRTGWTIDDWAEAACELQLEFGYIVGVGDSADRNGIEVLNKRMGSIVGREGKGVWQGSNKGKGKIFAISQVQDALNLRRMFLVRDALRYGRDEELDQRGAPCCTEEEIPSWTYLKDTAGRPSKDKPDPKCADHGMDCLQYLAVYSFARSFAPPDAELEITRRLFPGFEETPAKHWAERQRQWQGALAETFDNVVDEHEWS